MRGALRFSVLAIFRSVFPPQNFGFSVLVSVAVFPFFYIYNFKHLVFGSAKMQAVILGSGIRCGFRFFYLVSGLSLAIMRLNCVRVPRLSCPGSSQLSSPISFVAL